MTGPKATHQSSSTTPSLASRPLPPRVRTVLTGLLDLVGSRLQRRITTAFNDAEGLLFTLGSGSDEIPGMDRITAITRFQRAKTYVFPRFMVALEAALAVARDSQKSGRPAGSDLPMSDWLTLVDHDVQAEEAVITEISARANLRHSLPLSLLGQRFGVIAARPPYEPDRLPIGPRQLCTLLSEAMNGLEMLPPHRQMVLRQFDRAAIQEYGELIEAINDYLVQQDVLPTLHFIPLKKRQQDQRGDERTGRSQAGEPSKAQTAWPGEISAEEAASDAPTFPDLMTVLQHLVAARPAADSTAPPAGAQLLTGDELDAILAKLQQRTATAASSASVRDYPQLQAAIRSELPSFLASGDSVPLQREDAELLELMCLLFAQVMAHVRANSPSAALLGLIQLPLTRHVLLDRGVLARRNHAARRMLNTIAEAGATWRAEQDSDPVLLSRLQAIAERIARDYAGDGELFERLNDEVDELMRAQIERAKLSERRHIEAARGREKLALARLRAVESIDAAIDGRRIPDYVRTLLGQTWSDVLSLTLLRHGPDAPAFKRQADIASRLATAACLDGERHEPLSADEVAGLNQEIRQALGQVGYHEDEAQMIAAALTELRPEGDPGTQQRIRDIEARLAARSRLGEQLQAMDEPRGQRLEADVEAWRQRLLDLPFGTWMEFGSTDPNAHPIRSRLAWFSAVTGLGLFVNTRGQRVGEHALTWLAHEMAAGRLRIVEIGHDTLVDRAWDELVESLRQLAEHETADTGATA